MRLSLLEYGDGLSLNTIPSGAGANEEIEELIYKANSVIKKELKYKRDSLVVVDGKIKALGIAGIIRISKSLELEIIPKMLDDSADNWKESLFLLAALSKHGSVIPDDLIHSNMSYEDSLYELAARIIAREYLLKRRRFIRQYRKEKFVDFAIDGEIEFETVFDRNPDGFFQTRIVLDRINSYNSIIQTAMKILLPHIRDLSTRGVLVNAIQELKNQPPVSLVRLKVPARDKEWEGIYNLAFDICAGMMTTFDQGEILAPGFIVDTWRVWEWLVTTSMKIGLNHEYKIVPQAQTEWGLKREGIKETKVNVFPDVAVYYRNDTTVPAFLVDAKYKTLSLSGGIGIDRADLYEAYAFCDALGAKELFLAYPGPVIGDESMGEVALVKQYEIGKTTIYAIRIAFGSLSKSGGILQLCKKTAAGILGIKNYSA